MKTLITSTIGGIVGWALATFGRYFEERWFGPKLKIDCPPTPGNKGEIDDHVYMKFRVKNKTPRRVAKNCRAYMVGLHKFSNSKVVSENLIADSFQLPWAGHSFDARDIPAEVDQYVDLTRFSKHEQGWKIFTRPDLYSSLRPLADYRGTYRFTVVVAGDGAIPQRKFIFVIMTAIGRVPPLTSDCPVWTRHVHRNSA